MGTFGAFMYVQFELFKIALLEYDDLNIYTAIIYIVIW